MAKFCPDGAEASRSGGLGPTPRGPSAANSLGGAGED